MMPNWWYHQMVVIHASNGTELVVSHMILMTAVVCGAARDINR
jgi:hypothetical protein